MPAGARKAITLTRGEATNPFTDLNQVPVSGSYFLNLGFGTFRGYVDVLNTEKWLLILQYAKLANTNPPLTLSNTPPENIQGYLGTSGGDTRFFKHVGVGFLSQLPIESIRWFGVSSGHNRVIHFKSPVGISFIKSGVGSFAGLQSNFTPLIGHTSFLPGTITDYFSNTGSYALTNFPWYTNGLYHWGLGSLDRWEVDDYSLLATATIHRVFLRL